MLCWVVHEVNRIKFRETFFICVFIVFMSLALCNIDFYGNLFVFVVPWMLFCFLNDKWCGAISFLSCFICLTISDKWNLFIMLFVLSSIVCFKYLLKYNSCRFVKMVNLYNFFIVLVCSVFNSLITKNYFFIFFDSVLSYWVMKYMYEAYLVIHKGDKWLFNSRQTSFVLCLFALCFLGANIDAFGVDVSLIGVLILAVIGSKIGFEIGSFYALFVLLTFLLIGTPEIEISLFLVTSGINLLLLNKTNKVTYFFVYLVSSFLLIYYFKLEYYYLVEYVIASFVFLLTPGTFYENLCKLFCGNERYVKNLEAENKHKRMEMGNKMLRMEEIFSLVCKKVEEGGRLKKSDRDLMAEEINVFCGLMQNFSKEIKNDFMENRDSRFEKNFFQQGVDLVSFQIKEDILNNIIVKLNVRCEDKEINELIVPLANKIVKRNFAVKRKRYNDIFGYYELELVQNKKIGVQYGVSQRAKDGFVCGDSYLVYEGDDKVIFALSDGMGAGVDAKKRSKLALELFKKFMDTGFEVEQALTSLNRVLKGEYDRDSFATLDLLVYDKFSEKFCFYKNGASDSFVFKHVSSEVVNGNDLPLGIIDKIEFKANCIEVKKGEFVVMASDGVKEDNMSLMDTLKNKKPQVISKELLGKERDISDDETVIVVKIC